MATDLDGVAAVDKPSVYEEDGRWVYRASSLLNCNNALLAARLGLTGAQPPDDMQARYDEGHRQEPVILGQLESDYGFKVYGHQQEVEIKVGSALIRGHVDALAELTGVRVTSFDGREDFRGELGASLFDGKLAVVDAKALAPAGFDLWAQHKFEKYLYYLWQQAVYLYGLDWDAIVMAVKNKVTGELRADLFSRRWYEERLPKSTLLGRVLWVEREARKGPAALFENQCSPKQFPCPFYKLHPDSAKAPVAKVDDETDIAKIEESAKEHDRLKAVIKQAETDLAAVDKTVTGLFGNKVATVRSEWATISTYYSGGSATDWDAIANLADMPVDVVKERFTKKTKSTKLSIRVTKKKAEGS